MHLEENTLPGDSRENAQRFQETLFALSHALRRHHKLVQAQLKITATELDILQYLTRQGPQKMKEMAAAFEIKLSTLTSIIDNAEKRRILKRSHAKADRRVVLLEITPQGRQVMEKYEAYLTEIVQRMQPDLDKSAFDQMVRAMEEIGRL